MANRSSQSTANQTFSFITRTWLEAQRNADEDLKLVNQRMQSLSAPFNSLADSFSREWDQFKRTSLNVGGIQSSEGLFSRMNQNQSLLTLPADMEKLAAKRFNSLLTTYRALNLNVDWKKHEHKTTIWKPPPSKLEPSSVLRTVPKVFNSDDSSKRKTVAKPQKGELKFLVGWKETKLALQEWQKSRTGKRPYSLEEWEPLRRLRVSLLELETTAAASKTPKEFFQNLCKSEFFENTKRTMNIPMRRSSTEKELVRNDVALLDVPELLESLVRQSEPLLDQLGVKKGFSDKICSALRSWKHEEPFLSCVPASDRDVSALSKEAGNAVNELDLRIASVLNSTGYKYQDKIWGRHGVPKVQKDDDKRNITIATTASLPWMTGTAINPLFRAAYLAKNGDKNVTLLVPWLSKKDQELVYPNQVTFDSPKEQENYIKQWLNSRVSFQTDFKIVFYPGKFSESKRSILAVDDITQFIPEEEADIAILEEPEHLTWYHHGARWTRKFQHVVGVVHTNYLEYVKREKNGPFQAFLLKYVNNWVTNIYCHKIIRLSAATQNLPKSTVCNVHGVSPKFLDIGKTVAAEREKGNPVFTKGAYFLGKMVWGKGYRELIDLWTKHKEDLCELPLDVFGNGEDSLAVREEAQKHGLNIHFNVGRDHADRLLHGYKVFINPSVSDVVCTTTAEALAMGKIVVCADHPSNEFFKGFPNCFMYKDSEDFIEKVKQAMSSEPVVLSAEEQHMLSWEAATERFLQSTDFENLPAKGKRKIRKRPFRSSLSKMGEFLDYGMFLAHYCLSGIEVARLASGAIPGTMHMNEEQRRELGLVLTNMKRDMYYAW